MSILRAYTRNDDGKAVKEIEMNTERTLEMQILLQQTGNIFNEKDIPRIESQISVHKYLINQDIPWVITEDDATFSWQENVFHPIMSVMNSWPVRQAFKHLSDAELFFAVSDHWYYLLSKDDKTSAFSAAIDYAARYGRGMGKFVSSLANSHTAA